MRIVYFDTSAEDAEHFLATCRDVSHIEDAVWFSDSGELTNYLAENSVDFVFSEVVLDEANGLELMSQIKKSYPEIRIVFVTSSPEYAVSAFEVNHSMR